MIKEFGSGCDVVFLSVFVNALVAMTVVMFFLQDFILEYFLLLPHGHHSTQSDIAEFLATLDVSDDSFQIGRTKVGGDCCVM